VSPRLLSGDKRASLSEKDGDPMNRRRRFSVCAVLLGILISARLTEGQAQPSLVINGIVQDQTGAAFLGASVDLLKDGEQQRSVATDISGSFRFDNVQPGNYEVRTQKQASRQTFPKLRSEPDRLADYASSFPSKLSISRSRSMTRRQISVLMQTKIETWPQ
jgi:hypothetical protein